MYVKWFLKSLGPAGLPRLVADWEDKTGYAQTVFALAEEGSAEIVTLRGRCPGVVASPPRGKVSASSWDSIWQPADARGAGRTFAEMTAEEKNSMSHRGAALQKLVSFLSAGDE